MKEIKVYRVYNPRNGKFIVEGTASKCADKLGMDIDRFRRVEWEFRKGKYKKLCIYDVTGEEEIGIRECDRDVIEAWDRFVTPIRERYGIPVRHLGEGKK